MKITIGIPVFNQEEQTLKCLRLIFENTNCIDEIVIVDNGSTERFEDTFKKEFPHVDKLNLIVIRNEQNLGVRPALNQIFKKATGDIVVFTHNDVEIYEKGWDEKIRAAFSVHTNAGIIGAYGAKGIGDSNIYQVPYVMQQLARQSCVSNARMDRGIHGFRNLQNDFENVAVFDGFFMAIKKELLEKTQGFSDILPIHHSYDNLICIQSLENGYENILLSLDITHVGGQTDVKEDWVKGTGKSKADIHADAHPPLYEYGRGLLPIQIFDIYNEDDRIIGYELWMNRELKKEVMYQ